MKHIPHIAFWLLLTAIGRGQSARLKAYRYWRVQAVAARLAKRHPIHCAWCRDVIRDGNPALPVSHGICGPCYCAVRITFAPSHPLSYLPACQPRIGYRAGQ